MGYDQPERSNSSGAIVAVLVVVLLVAVLGGLFVVGVGAFFWVGTARVQRQAVLAESDARMQAERARAMAEEARAEAMSQVQLKSAATDASDSGPDLNVDVSEDGSLSLDGEPIDLDGLQERLAKLRDQSGTTVSVSLSVHPDCPSKHLQSLLTAFEEARVSWRWRGR